MTIAIQCTGCGARFRVSEQFAGKKVRCKKCNESIRVPSASLAAAPDPVEPTSAPESANDFLSGLATAENGEASASEAAAVSMAAPDAARYAKSAGRRMRKSGGSGGSLKRLLAFPVGKLLLIAFLAIIALLQIGLLFGSLFAPLHAPTFVKLGQIILILPFLAATFWLLARFFMAGMATGVTMIALPGAITALGGVLMGSNANNLCFGSPTTLLALAVCVAAFLPWVLKAMGEREELGRAATFWLTMYWLCLIPLIGSYAGELMLRSTPAPTDPAHTYVAYGGSSEAVALGKLATGNHPDIDLPLSLSWSDFWAPQLFGQYKLCPPRIATRERVPEAYGAVSQGWRLSEQCGFSITVAPAPPGGPHYFEAAGIHAEVARDLSRMPLSKSTGKVNIGGIDFEYIQLEPQRYGKGGFWSTWYAGRDGDHWVGMVAQYVGPTFNVQRSQVFVVPLTLTRATAADGAVDLLHPPVPGEKNGPGQAAASAAGAQPEVINHEDYSLQGPKGEQIRVIIRGSEGECTITTSDGKITTTRMTQADITQFKANLEADRKAERERVAAAVAKQKADAERAQAEMAAQQKVMEGKLAEARERTKVLEARTARYFADLTGPDLDKAKEGLIHLRSNPDEKVRKALIDALMAFLDGPDPARWEMAAVSLSHFHHKPAIPKIAKLITDDKPRELQEKFAQALECIGDMEGYELGQQWRRRQEKLNAAAAWKIPADEDEIIKQLPSATSEMQQRMCAWLYEYGTAKCLAALKALQDSRDSNERSRAREAEIGIRNRLNLPR